MVYREETLLNVMKSVTRNGRSILLTAIFAIILVYLFSILGFLFFRDDFLMDADDLVPVILDEGGHCHVEDGVNCTENEDRVEVVRYGENLKFAIYSFGNEWDFFSRSF